MADGIRFDTRAIDRSLKRLRKIAPALDDEMPKATLKSAEEIADLGRTLAPKRTGEYAASIKAKPIGELDQAVSTRGGGLVGGLSGSGKYAAGVFAKWIWHLLEFGTVNAKAQPHILPAYRLLRKRAVGRMRRAMTKSIKKALRG